MIEGVTAAAEQESLWRTHAGELIRYATLLVGPSEAADVVSAAFLKVTRTQRTEPLHNARAYLFRAVTTGALDYQRSRRRRQSRDLQAVLTLTTRTPDSDLDVRRAVADLSVRQRAVVYFTYWEDLGEDRVADLLGISPGAVRRHLARARFRLRKVLQ